MYLSSDIREKIVNSVVPISCGGDHGTAFFICDNVLLTARHVVADYFLCNSPIIIIYDGEQILCRAEELGDRIDVARLTCENCSTTPLRLLSAKFNPETKLMIVGYPEELGHCSDLITINIRNKVEVSDREYDVLVAREDSLGLHCYSGFSGSPVLNEKGSVVGIISDNIAMTLGYVSVKKLSSNFRNKQISFSEDYESEDMTQYGLGKAQSLLKDSIRRAGNRYTPDRHQACKDFEEAVLSICSKAYYDKKISRLSSIETWTFSPERTFHNKLPKYTQGEYSQLYGVLNHIDSLESKDLRENEREQNELNLQTLIDIVDTLEDINRRFVVVKGNAGCGKTHHSCNIARLLSNEANVYLLYGSQFSHASDLVDQIGNLCEFTDRDWPDKLQEHLADNGNFAIFIIDGLNEGPSEKYWQRQIDILTKRVKDNPNIKVVFSVRNDVESSIIKPNSDKELWSDDISLVGFEDTEKAIREYFKAECINDTEGLVRRHFKEDCRSPLFLKILCSAIHIVGESEIMKIPRFQIYRYYLYQRNVDISTKVDEDEHRNVTNTFLQRIANYSLFYCHCEPIGRKMARHYADQICRYRLWSKNLLNVCLKENILMPVSEERVMFEYEKLGEYLKVFCLLTSKMDDEGKLEFINRELKRYQSPFIRNFVRLFLAEWNYPIEFLDKPCFKREPLRSCFLRSLSGKRNRRDGIAQWVIKNKLLNPDVVFKHRAWFPLSEIETFSDILMEMNLHDRDLKWSILVNSFYHSTRNNGWCWNMINNDDIITLDEAKREAICLSWLCTSSYPIVRFSIMRKLTELFSDKGKELIVYLIEKMHRCNDPYVLQIIYASIYGYTLMTRDAESVDEIARTVYECHYKEGCIIPLDAIVRQWSLSILQRSAYLNPDSTYFTLARPPYKTITPNELIKDRDIEKDYFGNEDGSNRLYQSLFSFEDFNRYILGSNNSNDSKNFFIINGDECSPIPLEEIRTMMSNLIKHKYGWDDIIAKYDNHTYSTSRYENKTERIGKKYQWLALYEVAGILSDNVAMTDSAQYVYIPQKTDSTEVPYPWYFNEQWRTDPSMTEKKTKSDAMRLTPSELEDHKGISDEEWIADETILPKTRLELSDNERRSWIVLMCYDGSKDKPNRYIRDLFLFNNAVFFKNTDKSRIAEWAKEQNFYGRWMPESRGSIDFLWNEYPWADTFKRLKYDYPDHTANCPCDIYLSYVAQLQEDFRGLESHENIESTVYMPNPDVMRCLNLYTAERGIIRCANGNSVAAVNFRHGEMNGLAIRKELLDEYLKATNMSLIYYTCGEKYLRESNFQSIGARYDLSAAYLYQNGVFEEIQKLHISDKWPK